MRVRNLQVHTHVHHCNLEKACPVGSVVVWALDERIIQLWRGLAPI